MLGEPFKECHFVFKIYSFDSFLLWWQRIIEDTFIYALWKVDLKFAVDDGFIGSLIHLTTSYKFWFYGIVGFIDTINPFIVFIIAH